MGNFPDNLRVEKLRIGMRRGTTGMFSGRLYSGKIYKSLWLFIIMLSPLLLFLNTYYLSENYTYYLSENYDYSQEPGFANIENCSNSVKPLAEMLQHDPALNLLGKDFSDIKEILGEPAGEGSSNWYGPHNYISYEFNEGIVRFNSPRDLENNMAVSITLIGNHKILCARVGMPFSEIKNVLGKPSFGPEQGMDNLYYMEYFLGNINNKSPDIIISFSAEKIDGPTVDAFIKWESFDYKRINNIMEFQL